ncbi:unnamed protein product [Cylicocyclus nassatus]|uniref:Uncharacterized protein n=1 Tax=Cylicocyclus nassatus TaxID=53992 RepID=A0AA36M092_CYLNA|nr:unnamed protein product [Cylicocyclus nassatus]
MIQLRAMILLYILLTLIVATVESFNAAPGKGQCYVPKGGDCYRCDCVKPAKCYKGECR